MGKLNTARLRTLTKPGAYGDGAGLYLQVRGPQHRSWLYRFKLHGKAHLMGLGAFADVSLAEARDAATAARKLVRQGISPIDQRRAQRAENAAQAGLTFAHVAAAYIKAHRVGWGNAKHVQQWENTLHDYAFPVIGNLAVAEIDTGHVTQILEPIWTRKSETASRVRGRIEAVLDYAKTHGWRSGENPARWKGHLANVLAPRGQVQQVRHFPALAWAEIGDFMPELRKQQGVSAFALEVAILTAARTNAVIGARWSEIDLLSKTWTIPKERMKGRKDKRREHRVPLSDAALAVLHKVAKLRTNPAPNAFVFPGGKPGKGLSNMALEMVLRRMNPHSEEKPGRWLDPVTGDPITPHGFRSTFRDWCAEATNYAREVAEAALAHTLRDKTEAAYQRGDLFEKRRKLMGAWAAYCVSAKIGKVVLLHKAAT